MENRIARTLIFDKHNDTQCTIYLLVSGNNLFDVSLCWEDLSKQLYLYLNIIQFVMSIEKKNTQR